MSFLHTIVPEEVVFGPGGAGGEAAGGAAENAVRTVDLGAGRRLEVVGGKVSRLYSSDPQDFLDPRWQPGADYL